MNTFKETFTSFNHLKVGDKVKCVEAYRMFTEGKIYMVEKMEKI